MLLFRIIWSWPEKISSITRSRRLPYLSRTILLSLSQNYDDRYHRLIMFYSSSEEDLALKTIGVRPFLRKGLGYFFCW